MPHKPPELFDVAVIGGGLAGHTAALMLADKMTGTHITKGTPDFTIAIVAPDSPAEDGRTTALLGGSVAHLEKIGLWQQCQKFATPLSVMRILDGTNRIWRAPPVEFKAVELGLDAFGYNIANATLIRAMKKAVSENRHITMINDRVLTSGINSDVVELHTEKSGRLSARLAIAADGRNSQLRKDAGIDVREWRYPQTAIAVNFLHTLPHQNTSTEFHTEEGPFTIVPMPNEGATYQSGLVWIMQPHNIDGILQLPTEQLEQRIEEKMHSILGRITLNSKPQPFPMAGMIAKNFAAKRVALVGDAAHIFPPIGAQGFNLGLRDIVKITELASHALIAGKDPGDVSQLTRYDNRRRLDIVSRTGAVDLLNNSLLTDFLPVQALRGLGLFALAHSPALRKFAMQKGMAMSASHSNNAA